jgi:nitrite reductase/ring-hydroxylating ferredoxin subunit
VGKFVKVARREDIPEGTGITVEAEGTPIALFNAGGRFFAIHNTCLHRGGPLGEGELDGTIVTCPWHGWQYDVTSGTNLDDPGRKVSCFPVKIESDDILIEV